MESIIFSIGDTIEGRCTKCRKNLSHTIVTLNDAEPLLVQCNICNRQHKYRPPSIAKKPAVRQTNQHKDAECKEWESLRPGMNSAKATDYAMTNIYKA